MRELFSYIIALTVFFLASSFVGKLLGSYGESVNVDIKGIFLGITVGMLAAYYAGKWFSDKRIPYHAYIVVPVCAISILAYYLYQNFGYGNLLNRQWFQIYGLGVLFAIFTSILSSVWKALVEHLSGDAAIQKQIRKLFKTPKDTIYSRLGIPLALVLHSLLILTSWLCVILNIIDILGATYALSKVLLRSESEQFKRIKMPLINNQSLSTEKAWALLCAYSITMGASVRTEKFIADLEDIASVHTGFRCCEALDELQWLSVVKPEVIEEIRVHFEANYP